MINFVCDAAEKVVEEVVEEKKAPVKVEAKASDKKVPKHVREMQERLARMKEAEEKRIQGMRSFPHMLASI